MTVPKVSSLQITNESGNQEDIVDSDYILLVARLIG